MSPQYTRCPSCRSIYAVSVTQLTIAHGMVNCPRCETDFNALSHLVSLSQVAATIDTDTDAKNQSHGTHEQAVVTTNVTVEDGMTPQAPENIEQNLSNLAPVVSRVTEQELSIFSAKVAQSNLNLRSYLNSLGIHKFDNLVLDAPAVPFETHFHDALPHNHWRYYVLWGTVNLLLLILLIFQIAWFNPQAIHDSFILSHLLEPICRVLNCAN